MTQITSFFVALVAVVRFSGVSSFAGVPQLAASSSSYHARHVSRSAKSPTTLPLPSSRSCLRTAEDPATIPRTVSRAKPTTAGSPGSRPSGSRWHSRLGAAGDTLGDAPGAEESEATSGEGADGVGSATATTAPPAGGVGGAGVDLSKGIAFEAPKPKALEPEQAEEESDSKKIRVILYTVLSLVPFVLLLPFLGSRELMPLDPSQM